MYRWSSYFKLNWSELLLVWILIQSLENQSVLSSTDYSYGSDNNELEKIRIEFCRPRHVHIAYGDTVKDIVILWATKEKCTTDLEFGTSQWSLDQRTSGSSVEFWEQNFRGLHHLHRVQLTNLSELTTYFYHPLSSNVGSGPFYFRTPQEDEDWSPQLLVFGDLGVHSQTIPSLVEEALKGDYTALLHVGDFAYNLKDLGGAVGDRFMDLIQPVAAFLPYMTCPGNHEIDSDTFTHYAHRFSMPQSAWPMSPDKLWYSFNLGPAHFISYSTEVFFTLNGRLEPLQMHWLLGDLRKANEERHLRPWVIAFGHRPMSCSTDDADDCTRPDSLVRAGLEDVFFNFGVDLVLQAHEHNYERLYPMYKGVVTSLSYVDPRAPVQIITGAAGSKFMSDPFHQPPKPTWSAVRVATKSLNSFGRLQIVNGTHLYWEQRSVHNNALIDSLWLVQRRHGRFRLSDLPDDVASQIQNGSSTFRDFVAEDKLRTLQAMQAADTKVRRVIAVCFASAFTLLVLAALIAKFCGKQRRRYSSLPYWDRLNVGFKSKQRFTPLANEVEEKEEAHLEIDMGEARSESHQAKQLLLADE